MTIETTSARTRRAVLAGGLGAVAAVAANALAKPERALAADPNDVVLGGTNAATTPTVINNFTNGETVFAAQSNSAGPGACVLSTSAGAVAVRGQATTGNGVEGSSDSGLGVVGSSNAGPGVKGQSTNAPGVSGISFGQASVGVLGHSAANWTGVHGYSSGATGPPAAKAKTGVYGEATQDAASRGVWGYSPAGHGVRGEATTGRGVHGQATTGLGVRGFANSGVGLSGEATTGYALRTKGRVRLDQSAGQATIASGTSSVVVTPGIDLTTTTAVVATLNGDAGGSTAVKRVAVNATANTFTIYLTGNATATVKAAWIVLG